MFLRQVDCELLEHIPGVATERAEQTTVTVHNYEPKSDNSIIFYNTGLIHYLIDLRTEVGGKYSTQFHDTRLL